MQCFDKNRKVCIKCLIKLRKGKAPRKHYKPAWENSSLGFIEAVQTYKYIIHYDD